MEYRVLGTLEVLRDGEPLELGAHLQRSLLAMLLLRPNEVVSTDQLIDGLWADAGTADKQKSLWVYISGLRGALEPDREKRTEGTILLTRAPGYVLAVDPGEIDSHRFEQLVVEGRAMLERDPEAASELLTEALAMWRGRAFEDFTYDGFVEVEISRLEALRLEAVEARIEADLARGLGRELVSELESLVRQHPLREEFTAQLMQALYRSGRQAEALRTYGDMRDRLGDELGLEPSSRLQRLESMILGAEPSLEAAGGAVSRGGAQPGLAVRGYELREKIGEGAFGVAYRAYQPAVGREVAIKVIRPEFADDPSFVRRFEAEAQLVARLEHPHIVPLYDYWREPGAAYLVMRLMRGGNLSSRLEHGALTTTQAGRLVEQLGGALQNAHRADVVHRDIKPDNILMDDEGNAYLSDFGIASDAAGTLGDDNPTGPSTLGPPYASPEQLCRGAVTPRSDIYSLGVVVAQALTGLPGEIEQIRGALAPDVLRAVDRATASDDTQRYIDVGAFITELRRTLGDDGTGDDVRPDVPIDNPYKGLRSFDAGDAASFHGRERLIDRLIARVGERGVRGRFTAVVGPSGGGKSSVVKAGLLPAVRRGAVPDSDQWFVVEMTPGAHPFESLDEGLWSVAIDPPPLLLQILAANPDGIERAIEKVLPSDGSQLLLVIDQFEELFTQANEAAANRFLDALVAAITSDHSRLRVVATLRADFYDRPLRHRGLGELLRDGTEIITPMSPAELERAITGPVEPFGIRFDASLVAELVRDVVDRPSALPLLQYVLTELFETRAGGRITEESYHELGGMSGALVERADGLLANLGPDANDTARQVFLRLVTLGEGADDTRRRVLRSELDDLPVDRNVLKGVLDTFGRHRLLSFDRDPVTRGPTVEISHEALLSEWDRLRRWVDGARHDVRNQRRLAEAMDEWRNAGETDEYLVRGGRLDQLDAWAASASLPLADNEQAFLDASVAERDRSREEELEREQRALDAEAAARHRARQLTGATLAGLLVAALAVFGIVQWQSADDARQSADDAREEAVTQQQSAEVARDAAESAREQSQSLVDAAAFVTAAESVLRDDPELSLLLAVEAVHSTVGLGYATEEAIDSIHWALHDLGVQFDVDDDTPEAVRSGPTGLTGVWVLPPAELIEFAEGSLDRRLSEAECIEHLERPCLVRGSVPDGLRLRFGSESYSIDTQVEGFYDVIPLESLAGTRIRFDAGPIRFEPGFLDEIERFTQLTGIEVDVVGDAFDGQPVGTAFEADIADVVLYIPGDSSDSDVDDRTRARAIDLEAVIDVDLLRASFGDHLLETSTFERDDGTTDDYAAVRAIPVAMLPSDLVFYPRAEFEAAGYEVPRTWDELIALSQQMVDDGRTPWCWGFRDDVATTREARALVSDASGWPGTDLIESLVLRSAGPDAYDAWQAGDLPFSDPRVVEAGRLASELLFTSGFVRGGSESISSTYLWETIFQMMDSDPSTGERPPQCWMIMRNNAALAERPLGSVVGIDIDHFPLPPVDATGPPPVTGSALMAMAVIDRPEVRAFMSVLASEEWGSVWARDQESTFVSANSRFNVNTFRLNERGRVNTGVSWVGRRRMSEMVHAAIRNDTLRLDASDGMPSAIGQFNERRRPGVFWQGMLDWVDGERTIEEVFADIDEAWAALEADTS